jgi:alkylhydroperoxidase family enzyme
LGAIAKGPEEPSWSPRDRLLLRACDELHAHQQISDQTYDELRAELSAAQIVELVFVIGNYTMLSMVANATGVPLEERLPAMPQKLA